MGSPVIFAGGQAKSLKPELDMGEMRFITGTFAAANNQAAAVDVTGLSLANASFRAARITISVYIDATTDLHEVYDILVIQKAASWDLSQSSLGDESNVDFSITSAGQIQYVSGNETGYSSSVFKYVVEALDA